MITNGDDPRAAWSRFERAQAATIETLAAREVELVAALRAHLATAPDARRLLAENIELRRRVADLERRLRRRARA